MSDIQSTVTFWGCLHLTFAYTAVIVVQAKEEVKKLISKAQANELEAQPGRTIMESFENQVPPINNDVGRRAIIPDMVSYIVIVRNRYCVALGCSSNLVVLV